MKSAFLNHVVMALQLQNVSIEAADIRAVPLNKYDAPDTMTARAVAGVSTLWEWMYPFMHSETKFLLQSSSSEVAQISNATNVASHKVSRGWIITLSQSTD